MYRLMSAVGVLLIVSMLCGCESGHVAVHEQKYTFNASVPPAEAFAGPDTLTPREAALGKYAATLYTEVQTYDRWAIKSNYDAGYYVNPDQMAFAGIGVKKSEDTPQVPRRGIKAKVKAFFTF